MSLLIESTHLGTSSLTTGRTSDTVHVLSTDGETTIDTSGGGDTVNIQTIDAVTTVQTGDDNDTVNVGSLSPVTGGTLNEISAPLWIDGELGTDELNVDDTGDADPNNGTLTDTMITGLGMSDGIHYEVEELNIKLGMGGDTFTIESTHARRNHAAECRWRRRRDQRGQQRRSHGRHCRHADRRWRGRLRYPQRG